MFALRLPVGKAFLVLLQNSRWHLLRETRVGKLLLDLANFTLNFFELFLEARFFGWPTTVVRRPVGASRLATRRVSSMVTASINPLRFSI